MKTTQSKIYRIKRWFKHFTQRRVRGFDDSETWNLDHNIAKFTLPRLKRFKDLNNGNPVDITWEQWQNDLDDMIYAMENTIKLSDDCTYECDFDRLNKGLILFGKMFRDLWW